MDRKISELEFAPRATETLVKAGIETVGQFLTKLAEGDEAVLAIDGFGQKSLIDLKKKLRQIGYDLPAGKEKSVR
ncbi:MAG: DNA-directed RNA polymerase subunit alpha C-terminal domain-containing protein [Anaerolineaceae bacterium]